ncbi:MAG: acyl-CoA thioesterase [Eubacteriales bacterium]|nr:acyl-CoA thioesterase [Eubacteriales bacterium]
MANEIQLNRAKEKIKILPFEHRARYSETDQQGVIHHSNYFKWMEDARMNLLEQIGLGYKQMEAMEIMLPTISESIEYYNAVKFDDIVVINTKLISYDGRKMEIAYRIYDKETGEDSAVARSSHCVVNKSGIPISLKRIYPELETKFFEFR